MPQLALQRDASSASEIRHVADGAVVGKRVLVADDNRDAAESLALLLRLQGYEVRVATDGLDTLDVAQQAKLARATAKLGLKPGMTVAVETTLSLNGEGSGYEETVLVTDDGYEIMTAACPARCQGGC